MVSQGALDGSSVREDRKAARGSTTVGTGGEKGGRRGGLGVWYQTQGREESVKGEVTDFVATTPLERNEAPAVRYSKEGLASLRFGLSKLVLTVPMDTLKERMEEQKGLLVRHSLVKRHAQVKMLTSYRDAHIYIFPYWVKEMARLNEKFQSVSEDLVGWWAKSEWQTGLGDKLKLREIFEVEGRGGGDSGSFDGEPLEEEVDVQAMTTTKSAAVGVPPEPDIVHPTPPQESKVPILKIPEKERSDLTIPPVLAYIHSSKPSAPLVRRVDSSAVLLSVSLLLAKLESVEEAGRAAASPFAHSQKVAFPAGVAQRCTVSKADSLLAENVTVEEKSVIKESVIGANSHIASGARLTRCLVMDGAVIGERSQLTGCIIGRRSKVERECVLKESEVQDGYVVPEETNAKNEKFMIFEGLEKDTDEGFEVSEEFDNDGDDLGF